MKITTKGSSPLTSRSARNTTRYCFLFTLLAALACFSTLVFSGSAHVWSRKSKASRAGHASTTTPRKAATKRITKKDRDAGNKETEFAAGEADDPDGRWNWFWFQRMYPFDEIPEGARRRAWDSLPRRDKTDLNSASLSQTGLEPMSTVWSPIGPAPTTSGLPGGPNSGRINAIAVSPANTQIVLIGSATGGIWRSTDAGTTFVPVTDNQVDLSVGTIAFAPSNPNIVYAGMGDIDNGYFGTGVLKSTDAGLTWTRINNNNVLPEKGECMRIQVDPTNPDKVYLAQYAFVNLSTNQGFISGIYISSDGGVNWTKPFSGLVRDLVIHPTNPQILYAGVQFKTGDNPGLYKSIDGGQTWTNVFLSPYTSSQSATRDFRVAVTPAKPDRVYIYFGTRTTSPFQVRLEMSDDAGVTWTNRGVISNNQIDPGQFGYNTYLAASPTDANTVYVGTRDLFRSTDGGVTFTDLTNSFAPPYPNGNYQPGSQKFHSDQQSFAFEPGNSNTFYAGCDGGLFKTTNAGANFTSLNTSLSLTQFVSIGVHPTDGTKSYGGTQDNGTQRRLVGTSGWREFSSGDGGQLVINPLNTPMVFTSYVLGSVSRFLSDGFSFNAKIADADSFGESLTDPRINFYPPVVGNGVDAKLYVGTWRLFVCSDCDNLSKVWHGSNPPTWTAPGGTTDLTTGTTDVLNAIAVAKSNINVIYTGSIRGKVMASQDAGVTWTDKTTGLPARSITSITVSPTDPSLVYLTVSGYGTGHIFKSTNSGTAWTNISNNLPNIPTNAFLIDPLTSTTLYAGTDIGVFQSTDGGTTWSVFNSNLPPVPVLAFTAQASGLIQIGTYGRGAYELPLSNPTPTPTPTPPPVNDNFANAQIISGCSGSVTGTNVGATKELGEPNNPDSPNSTKSVWYQWQAPSTGTVTITTAGSTFDTVLAVYVGTSLTSLGTAIAHNDDIPDVQGQPHNVTSSVMFPATAGTVYRITVNGFDNGGGGDIGNIVLNWSGCTFQPTTLTSSQVEIKTWTFQGRTYAYVKLLFPNASYRVANWAQAVKTGTDFAADAVVEQQTGTSVQAVTTTAQIYDLGVVADGNYTFTFKNSGAVVKSQAFTVSSATPPPNPIDDARQFVKQQYRDFLNREADQAGEDFWTDNITKCNDPARLPAGQTVAQCTLRQRETTSGAFFLSPEFQYTGYYVLRMYKGALGRQPKLSEFTPDAQFVGSGIIVNGQLSAAKINQNKADFAAQFVNCTDATKYRCAEFKAIYDGLNNQQYVDRLFQTTGVNASASDRTALVNGLNAIPATETRASVLQKVVDGIVVIAEGSQTFTTSYGQAFYTQESNRAFVQLEYFGYMKRDPDDAGYAFWLGKLNQFGGNFVNAEMVLAFISSPEYRARFGQP